MFTRLKYYRLYMCSILISLFFFCHFCKSFICQVYADQIQTISPEGYIEVSYKDDVFKPDNWIFRGNPQAKPVVSNGVLTFNDKSGEATRYENMWNADFQHKAVIETRVKTMQCDAVGNCGIYWGDGEHDELLTLFPDRIELLNCKQNYKMDTTDDYHLYRIEVVKGALKIFVDDKLVLEGKPAKSKYCFNKVAFGKFSTAGAGQSSWDFFMAKAYRRGYLHGGRVQIKKLRILDYGPNDMNFPFARRFSNGTIWLTHSVGLHTVTESLVSFISTDNGKNFVKVQNSDVFTLDTCELPDGSVLALKCWEVSPKRTHTLQLCRWENPVKVDQEVLEPQVEFPFETTCRLHKSLLRLKDGRLIASGYGKQKGKDKFYCFCLESCDNGKTWKFLSNIIPDSKASGNEGYTEPCFAELSNGEILCHLRSGDPSPLLQVKSVDGGKTWSEPKVIAPNGVNPSLVTLSDGTLLSTRSRPGITLLVDFTGTGNNWQQVPLYTGPGSAYTSLLELSPGRVLMIYDESGFALNKGLGALNRIMGLELEINKVSGKD